jgi:hypothetical protein
MRLLDTPALAVLIAVMDMKTENWPAGWTAERIGLISVSGSEPYISDLPDFTRTSATSDSDLECLRSAYQLIADQKPTDWLRQMANNAICQAAIVARILGPTLHLIGGGDSCSTALGEGLIWLDSGAADAVLLVAYAATMPDDPGPERGDAVGIILAKGEEGLPGALDRVDLNSMVTSGTAIEAMATLASAVRPAAPSQAGSA